MGKKSSAILFWAKYIGLILGLIIIAVVMITLKSSMDSAPVPEGKQPKRSVAEGMSDFYATHRMSATKPVKEDLGDFVVQLNNSKDPIDKRLAAMESKQKPVTERWKGEHKFRSFEAGSTLREAITTFAASEGMQVIWELDKDFIVKHHFQVEDTVTGSIKQIASAIDASFEGEVMVYMCNRQRSLVITDKQTVYLQSNCEPMR